MSPYAEPEYVCAKTAIPSSIKFLEPACRQSTPSARIAYCTEDSESHILKQLNALLDAEIRAHDDQAPSGYVGLLNEGQGKEGLETAPEMPAAIFERVAVLSRGSKGHPDNCAPPCKYFKKKRGCKDGANCNHCHICTWRPNKLPVKIDISSICLEG